MRKTITTSLLAIGAICCFAACSAGPETGEGGEQLVPDLGPDPEMPGKLKIDKTFESSLECHVEACFRISSEHPLDYVGIDANVEASSMQFFELDGYGKKLPLTATLQSAAELSVHASACHGLPENCKGIGPMAKTEIEACITLDASVGIDDVTVWASAGGQCKSSSFSLEVSAECSGSIEIPGGGSGGSGGSGGGSGSGGSGGDGNGDCDGGKQSCDGKCVDCDIDLDHCGGCGQKCDGKCVAGVCIPKQDCDLGKLLCGGSCVDLDLDPLNCGWCGNVCKLGKCLLGKCVL